VFLSTHSRCKNGMGRWLFLPDTVQKDLDILSRSSRECLGGLQSLLDSEEGLRAFAVYLRVAEILGISDQEAAGLYSFWEYVQQERVENEKTGGETIDEFLSFLEGKITSGKSQKDKDVPAHIASLIKQKKSVLAKLFEDCPNREFAKKTSLLESGPLPHLANIRTFCDIRPIYNKDGTAIIDHVALITLRLGTHSGHLDENKEVLINLRELDVDRIERELKRLRQKLEVLKKSSPMKPTKAKKSRGE
jgi:hypothetical protein